MHKARLLQAQSVSRCYITRDENNKSTSALEHLLVSLLKQSNLIMAPSILRSSKGWLEFVDSDSPNDPPAAAAAAAAAANGRQSKQQRRRSREGHSWRSVTWAPYNDGHHWRKYGEKKITNFKFPRSYYRCTNRGETNCPATKQVQQKDNNDPPSFWVTYTHSHNCAANPPLMADWPRPQEPKEREQAVAPPPPPPPCLLPAPPSAASQIGFLEGCSEMVEEIVAEMIGSDYGFSASSSSPSGLEEIDVDELLNSL